MLRFAYWFEAYREEPMAAAKVALVVAEDSIRQSVSLF